MITECKRCNRISLIHAKGLCLSCYSYLHANPSKSRTYFRKWVKNNKLRHAESMLKYWKKKVKKLKKMEEK